MSSNQFHRFQRARQPLRPASEIGDLADRAAVGVQRKFVVGTERTYQGRVGLVHFLDCDVRHPQVEQDRHRKLEGIAGEIRELLRLSVFKDGEIFWQAGRPPDALGRPSP